MPLAHSTLNIIAIVREHQDREALHLMDPKRKTAHQACFQRLMHQFADRRQVVHF